MRASFWCESGCNYDPMAMSGAERRAMRSIRYADGLPVQRGDEVTWKGERWRVIGFDTQNMAAILQAPGRSERADPLELKR